MLVQGADIFLTLQPTTPLYIIVEVLVLHRGQGQYTPPSPIKAFGQARKQGTASTRETLLRQLPGVKTRVSPRLFNKDSPLEARGAVGRPPPSVVWEH